MEPDPTYSLVIPVHDEQDSLRELYRRLDDVFPQLDGEVEVLFVDEQPSDVTVPASVELKVTQTDPGLKGDTASGGGNKPATLESGAVVQVPLFIEEGETIRVDTRKGEYVSRA